MTDKIATKSEREILMDYISYLGYWIADLHTPGGKYSHQFFFAKKGDCTYEEFLYSIHGRGREQRKVKLIGVGQIDDDDPSSENRMNRSALWSFLSDKKFEKDIDKITSILNG